ncbi:hypothetical protein COCCU_12585 [Corynebacterium occultum]|uniref:DUF1023 domain-containing protein n=1 Tax=Corynebacterium occultum TaxID=2675219 RepID=A0A6B8W8Y4_9CORY|nr:alpha/beta hydrolase [Corynebacterium occultum]QGU08417.1 hypothetical protein COCCU_12585 [Corynebacterium occultum]
MNTLLPFHSSELLSNAQLLSQRGGQLHSDSAERKAEWSALSAETLGMGFEHGFALLLSHHSPIPLSATQILAVSELLAEVADLLRPWEELQERVLPLVEALGEYHPVVTMWLQHISHAAALLDFICAREITARSGAHSPGPLRSFADFEGLAAGAIHEHHLPRLPPELAQLVAEQPDIQVLELSEGAFVAAIGDIDSADAVVTIAAGTGSADPAGWPTQFDRARNISQTSGAATVLWMGHPAPGSVPEAMSRIPAQLAGPKLRDFQAELARRNPGQQRVVVGYSYGSVVLGEAASPRGPGLAADEVVLVGSPGIGLSRADHLNLVSPQAAGMKEADMEEEGSAKPRVHAVTGSADPIGLSATAFGGVHGVDPTSRFFGAQVWESAADHSGYWNEEEFLRQLSTLTTGR